MNWPAPSVLPPPPVADTDDTTTIAESAAQRRGLSAVPTAAWLALLGASLLITAATAIVASNWNAIGEGLRVAGLVAGTIGLLVGAERFRATAPTSASVIAHAGTYLTTFVGIATMSLFGFTWPSCILVGGLVLASATNWQADRWRRVTMYVAQVVGLALVAAGSAALLSTSAGLIAVLIAVGLLVAGAQRRSVAMAVAAVLSPALAAFAELGIGAGSLERAGLVGEPLGWSGPLVGLVAATVIGAIGTHRRNNALVLVAAASPVIGIITGLAATDADSIAWWSVPALALIAAEIAHRLRPDRSVSSVTDELLDLGAGVIAAGLWLSPVLVSIANWGSASDGRTALAVALTGLAIGLSTLRWHDRGSRLVDGGLGALAAMFVALPTSFGAHELLIASSAVVAVAVAAALSRRLSPIAIHGAAGWALVTVVAAGDPGSWAATGAAGALLATLVAVVVAARARLAAANGPMGWIEMTAVTWAAGLGAASLWNDHRPAIALGAAALVALSVVLADRRHRIWAIVAVGATGLIGFDAATTATGLADSYVVGWIVVTIVCFALWVTDRHDLWSYAAASSTVITAATSAAWFDIPAVDVTVMAMLATVTLTGLAWTFGRTPLDAAALTAGAVLLTTTTFPIDPVWASAAWVLIGLQIAVVGIAITQRAVAWAGIVVTIGGLANWWETSGLHDWFLDAVAPLEITGADLWAAALSVAALIAGAVVRHTTGANSWIAYTAALLIAGLWLTSAQIERDPAWAVPLLITVGIGAVVAGGWRRLAAPLVGGTVLTATGVLLAVDSDLTAVPTWVWLALGGGTLLGTAVLIERAGRPGSPDLRELVTRWD